MNKGLQNSSQVKKVTRILQNLDSTNTYLGILV
jgi:hypothetical protein